MSSSFYRQSSLNEMIHLLKVCLKHLILKINLIVQNRLFEILNQAPFWSHSWKYQFKTITLMMILTMNLPQRWQNLRNRHFWCQSQQFNPIPDRLSLMYSQSKKKSKKSRNLKCSTGLMKTAFKRKISFFIEKVLMVSKNLIFKFQILFMKFQALLDKTHHSRNINRWSHFSKRLMRSNHSQISSNQMNFLNRLLYVLMFIDKILRRQGCHDSIW